jgi:hypothetical protein
MARYTRTARIGRFATELRAGHGVRGRVAAPTAFCGRRPYRSARKKLARNSGDNSEFQEFGKVTENRRMDEAEARSILEDLARTGPPTARVASLKVLLALDKEAAEAAKEPERTPFDDLYDVEPPPRSNGKTRKANS